MSLTGHSGPERLARAAPATSGGKHMKALLWIGMLVLIAGIASLFVPIPHNERAGFKAGDVSVGIETSHEDKVLEG
jgi:hypothetical protein